MTFTALLSSELRRLLARRVVRWGLVVALIVVALVCSVATIRSSETRGLMKLSALWLDRARSDGSSGDLVLQMSIYVFILVVGLAATAVGGDYRAGTMGTILTWEPRRVRVAAARVVAVAVVAVGLYLVVIGALVGGWSLGAAARGSTAGLGPDFWVNLAAIISRGAIAAALVASLTAGLALVTRSTVGAVITWFGYLIGVEAVLGQRFRSLQPSLFVANLGAFLQDADIELPGGSQRVDGTSIRLFAQPGAGLVRVLAIGALLAGLGVLAFRRRDVT